MSNIIDAYISHKELAWSKTTLRSERYRLRQIKEEEELYDPRAAYLRLRDKLKPYTLKTLFIRLSALHDWLIQNGTSNNSINPYKQFLKENAGAFKAAYKKEEVELSYSDVVERLGRIKKQDVREHALHMLYTGMRFSESLTESNGYVLGKGAKMRRLFGLNGKAAPMYTHSYDTFRRELKKVGVKPHTLRKLFATELVRKGITAPDLMRILGWSSMQTATSYLQARRDSELDLFVKEVINHV